MAIASYLSSGIANARSATVLSWQRLGAALSREQLGNAAGRAYFFMDFLSKIAIVLGIVFSAYQFVNYQKDERIRYTFGYIDKFDGERYLAARGRIEETLRAHETKIAHFNAQRMTSEAGQDLRRKIANFLVNESRNGAGIVADLDLLVDFFEGIEICLTENLCERGVAEAFLQKQSEMLWLNFGPYIEDRRTIIGTYGRGLEAFALRALQPKLTGSTPDQEQK